MQKLLGSDKVILLWYNISIVGEFIMNEQFHNTFIAKEDRQFLDSIDATLSEYSSIDQSLDDLCQEIPRNQNAIKMLDQYADYYDCASDEEKLEFIQKLEIIIEQDEGPNSFLSRVATTFLRYERGDNNSMYKNAENE